MPEHSTNPFLEALHAGLSPIPVFPGTKQPACSWKRYQTEPVEDLIAMGWHERGFGIGLVCGAVSGRLMALDFEAGIMDRLIEVAQAMRNEELEATFTSWMNGYCESTPRGGMHILVHLEGDGPCPPNEVFARDKTGNVLIETRGEGGFVIVAPTPGYQLLSGGFGDLTYSTLDLLNRHG